MNRLQGKFVVFEGIDGSGKTTVLRSVAEMLRRDGFQFSCSKEPSESVIGRNINKYLYGENRTTKFFEATAFILDRIINLRHNVIPNLENGIHVLQDRYYFSTLAFQDAEDFDIDAILSVHQLLDAPQPDVLIYVDVPLETSLKRAKGLDVLERRDVLKKAKETYEKIFYDDEIKSKVCVIDGDRPLQDVVGEVYKVIHALFARNLGIEV